MTIINIMSSDVTDVVWYWNWKATDCPILWKMNRKVIFDINFNCHIVRATDHSRQARFGHTRDPVTDVVNIFTLKDQYVQGKNALRKETLIVVIMLPWQSIIATFSSEKTFCDRQNRRHTDGVLPQTL